MKTMDAILGFFMVIIGCVIVVFIGFIVYSMGEVDGFNRAIESEMKRTGYVKVECVKALTFMKKSKSEYPKFDYKTIGRKYSILTLDGGKMIETIGRIDCPDLEAKNDKR